MPDIPSDSVLIGGPVGGPARRVTGLVLSFRPDALPSATWSGVLPPGPRTDDDAAGFAAQVAAASAGWAPGAPSLLPEQAHRFFGRPGLVGHRLRGDDESPDDVPRAGRDWTPRFTGTSVTGGREGLVVEASDVDAGLALRTEVEPVEGGALRARHAVTNTAAAPYVVESLEVVFPLPVRAAESLDFTGRHLTERVAQRRAVTDGLWLRESRRGRPGHDAATVLVAGTPGFGFGHGEVWAVHVGWSGNQVHRLERTPDGTTTIGGGELLLPGEIVLGPGETYASPWVYLAASDEGLDGVAAAYHAYLRSLPNHPSSPRPVTLNVWEAVYFDHDHDRLRELAEIAAAVGVERFVLDDGWFRHRRHDQAGLGDWWVDEGVYPTGLGAVADRVHELGMQFGLWFEPEMVNPDSDLYRAHPEWILSARGRAPMEERNQQVLDLSRPEVVDYLLERMDAVLTENRVDYVKWDHNRDLLEAGSSARDGAPAVHDQTLGYYRLLDELRRRHPDVEWESCASGGGRVDLAVLERTERIWVSDMTDAFSRQRLQRWTTQLVAPEYLGAHISSELSHQTGRHLPLSFRAATAFFGHFGIEWDLSQADAAQRAHIADWIALYKEKRDVLHTGRVVRVDHPDEALWVHGVVATDASRAVVALVQMTESMHNRPVPVRFPGLAPDRLYDVHRIDPQPSYAGPQADPGDRGDVVTPPSGPLSGAVIADVGFTVGGADTRKPPQRPETVVLLEIVAR